MSAVIIAALISMSVFSQDGIVTNYKKQITDQNKSFKSLLKESPLLRTEDLKDFKELHLQKDFLRSLLFYTPKRFLKLGTKDRCSFYDLLLSNNLKGQSGQVDFFLIKVTKEDNSIREGKVPRADFIQDVIMKECPASIKFSKFFTLSNLKNTLKKFSFKTPKNINECKSVHTEILKDHKTPYFCYLSDEIRKISILEKKVALTSSGQYKKLQRLKKKLRKSKTIAKQFSSSARGYLNNMCVNLDKQDQFCEHFFSNNFYKKILKKEASPIYVKNMCLDMYKRFTKGLLKTCIHKLTSQPQSCITLNKNDRSLFPKPNCDEISRALSHSRLKVEYTDCPSITNNETITGISRLLRHFSKESYPINKDCSMNSASPYVSYNLKENGEDFWLSGVCFDDKINRKEVCYPSVFGESVNKKISLDENIKKILVKTHTFTKDLKCTIIPKESYKPILLTFQSGCFVLRPARSCKEDCRHRIILNQKEVKNIRFLKEFDSHYIASSYLNEGKSQSKRLVKNLKLRTRPILNTTLLKEHFKNHPKSLLHGVACAESLYPDFFKIQSLNFCSPVTFIVDGFIEKNGKMSLVTRSSIDSVHAPRILSWRKMFNGIKSYQKYHPLNLWSLYALYN